MRHALLAALLALTAPVNEMSAWDLPRGTLITPAIVSAYSLDAAILGDMVDAGWNVTPEAMESAE